MGWLHWAQRIAEVNCRGGSIVEVGADVDPSVASGAAVGPSTASSATAGPSTATGSDGRSSFMSGCGCVLRARAAPALGPPSRKPSLVGVSV